MWGKQVWEDDIDFEWPSQELLEKKGGEATLQSLEFKDWGVSITSIKITLSNGLSSPEFHKEGISQKLLKNAETIYFGDSKPAIRAVSAYDNGHQWHNIRCIKFFDAEFEEIGKYNPREFSFDDAQKFRLGEN